MRTVGPDASASYAAEVARLLWPDPWGEPHVTRSRHRREQPHRDAYLFPSARRPRLLVPADLPTSSSMLRRLGDERSPLAGPLRGALERSVRSPAFALARWPILRVPGGRPGADSIENHLATCFGAEVRVGVVLGPRRANQKPVLQVFDLEGALLGFAKVGHNPLTSALVRREARSLSEVGRAAPSSFRAPTLVHHGRWNGLDVLAMTPLLADPRLGVTPATRVAAMREVASLSVVRDVPLAASTYFSRLRASVRRLAPTVDGHRLVAALDALEDSDGTVRIDLGAWHGDWGRWNMGVAGHDVGVLQLWDWERHDPDVPVGFDALHFAAQSVRPGTPDERTQEEHFLRSVPRTLTELGVDPGRHGLTLRLYLLEMAVRYTDALAYGETPVLHRRCAWVLALLDQLTTTPSASTQEGA